MPICIVDGNDVHSMIVGCPPGDVDHVGALIIIGRLKRQHGHGSWHYILEMADQALRHIFENPIRANQPVNNRFTEQHKHVLGVSVNCSLQGCTATHETRLRNAAVTLSPRPTQRAAAENSQPTPVRTASEPSLAAYNGDENLAIAVFSSGPTVLKS